MWSVRESEELDNFVRFEDYPPPLWDSVTNYEIAGAVTQSTKQVWWIVSIVESYDMTNSSKSHIKTRYYNPWATFSPFGCYCNKLQLCIAPPCEAFTHINDAKIEWGMGFLTGGTRNIEGNLKSVSRIYTDPACSSGVLRTCRCKHAPSAEDYHFGVKLPERV